MIIGKAFTRFWWRVFIFVKWFMTFSWLKRTVQRFHFICASNKNERKARYRGSLPLQDLLKFSAGTVLLKHFPSNLLSAILHKIFLKYLGIVLARDSSVVKKGHGSIWSCLIQYLSLLSLEFCFFLLLPFGRALWRSTGSFLTKTNRKHRINFSRILRCVSTKLLILFHASSQI